MIEQKLQELCGKEIGACSYGELYAALMKIVKEMSREEVKTGDRTKALLYISGISHRKLLSNNLINLGIYDEVEKALKAHGKSMAELEESEPEPSLGNGGLGRSGGLLPGFSGNSGLPGDGIGLRYHCGLFHQVFRKNLQCEEPDFWMEAEQWTEDTGKTYTVSLAGKDYQAHLYQLDVTGYEGRTNKLNLFDLDTVDESLIQEGISFDKENIAKNLTLFLYPDDSDDAGRLLRIYQQYLMVSAGAQMILEECRERGSNYHDLAEYAAFRLMTHIPLW